MKKPDNTTLLLILGGLILLGGGFFGLRSIVNPTAQEDKAQDLRRRDLLKNLREILSAGYLQEIRAKFGANLPMLNPAKLKELATQIEGAIGFFTDDEAAIFAAFQKLTSKFEAHALATTYNNMFGQDLFAALANNLNQQEVTYIASIIDKLKIK